MLGAAAFLIAEFLKISYLDVIWMATIPTCLYYLSLLFMVELDAKRFGAQTVAIRPVADAVADDQALRLPLHLADRRHHLHAVAAIRRCCRCSSRRCCAFALSFLRPDTAMNGQKLVRALADGSIGVLNAATTCASAGIIVGVVTLTGLGLKFSSIVLDYAGGSLLLTALYTALIVWIVGLAVPVTASYIICAVIAAPALIKLGVPDFAAHMFIFYYAVLSEVSPPTALSPFAAAAITGGDPYKTTLQAWKYTLPAFLVPFVFVLDPQGVGLLMKIPKDGSWIDIVDDHGEDRAGPRRRSRPRRRTGRCGETRSPNACCGCSPACCWCSRACSRHGRSAHPATTCRYPAPFGLAIGVARPAETMHAAASPRHRRPAAEADKRERERHDATARHVIVVHLVAGARAVAARRAARSRSRRPSRSAPAAPAACTIRSAAASPTCCRSTSRAIAGDRARSPAARSTISS